MNRQEFRAVAGRLAWMIGESALAELVLAADEYAACLAEEIARGTADRRKITFPVPVREGEPA
jgi:hypothetical protein